MHGIEAEPEDDELRETAYSQLMESALVLLAEALTTGGPFPGETKGLRDLIDRVRARIPSILVEPSDTAGRSEDPDVPRILVSPDGADGLKLRAEYQGNRALLVTLHRDGTLSDESVEAGYAPLPNISEEDEELVGRTMAGIRFESASLTGELVRVVATPWQDPASAVITSVEIFTDGFVARYFAPGVDWEAAVERGAPAGMPVLSVTDDVGTAYLAGGGGGGGGSGYTFGYQQFTPAIPAQAQHLVVRSQTGSVEIDLRDA